MIGRFRMGAPRESTARDTQQPSAATRAGETARRKTRSSTWSLCQRPDATPEIIFLVQGSASAMRSAIGAKKIRYLEKHRLARGSSRVYYACMSDQESRLSHATRRLVRHDPHHVVLTVHDDVPPLHRREIRDFWLSLLAEARRRYPDVTVAAGCAMPSHYHLILQSSGKASDISRVIQFVASKLARAINRLVGRTGAVFSDRYFSRVLSTVSELIQALKYVGQNPVKARLVRRPEDWAASSVAECLGRARPTGAWGYRGWMYKWLGFFENAAGALARILSGEAAARKPGRHRQMKLPFARGLPGARAV